MPENRFTIQNADGSFTGFEVDLWKEIAKQLNLEYHFEAVNLFPNLLDELKTGQVDFGIGMISMGRERSDYIQFTYPYFASNLGIFTAAKRHTFGTLIRPVLTPIVARIIIMICVVIFVFGNILWISERGDGSAISRSYFPGIFEAMWCTFAIQSTIGFGDVIPRRWVARLLSIPIWICGLLLVAVITAQLLTNYTNEEFYSLLKDHRDLSGKVVATVSGTMAADTLDDLGVKKLITVPTAADLQSLYPRLESGEIDALVFDYPSLAVLTENIKARKTRPFLVGDRFHEQFYAIAMNKKLAETHPELWTKINLKILELRDSGFINSLHVKWFGNLDVQ